MDTQNPNLGDENPILAWLRAKLMSQQAPIVQNQSAMDQIDALERGPSISSGTIPNMAFGGQIPLQMSAPMGDEVLGKRGFVTSGLEEIIDLALKREARSRGMKLADLLKEKAKGVYNNPEKGTYAEEPTIGYAQGGMVQPDLSTVAGNLNNIPPTNYNLYKDVSAEDRANLYKKLLAKQNSGGNLAASALGGLGDAIANSFGGQHTSYQKDIMNNARQNTADQVGALDTERSQRTQDMSGNQEMMMNDPNSPISQSLRQAAQKAGLQVPSMMPANVLIKVIPGFGDLALKQTNLGIQQGQADESKRHNKVAEGLTATNQESDTKEKQAGLRQRSAETLSHRGPLQRVTDFFAPSQETKVLQDTLKDGASNPPPHGMTVTQNGHTYTWNGTDYE